MSEVRKTKPEDRFAQCKHMTEIGYCLKIRHHIINGYASARHCGKCEYFEKKEGVQ